MDLDALCANQLGPLNGRRVASSLRRPFPVGLVLGTEPEHVDVVEAEARTGVPALDDVADVGRAALFSRQQAATRMCVGVVVTSAGSPQRSQPLTGPVPAAPCR